MSQYVARGVLEQLCRSLGEQRDYIYDDVIGRAPCEALLREDGLHDLANGSAPALERQYRANVVLETDDTALPRDAREALGEGLPAHPLMRNASTAVYLTHMMVVVVLFQGALGQAAPYSVASGAVNSAILYLCTLALSGAVAALAIAASRRWSVVKKVFGF